MDNGARTISAGIPFRDRHGLNGGYIRNTDSLLDIKDKVEDSGGDSQAEEV